MAKKWIVGCAAALLLAAAVLAALRFSGVISPDAGEEPVPEAAEAPVWPEATRAPSGEIPVVRNEGSRYFPEEKNWVYHFTYAYPRLLGGSYTVAQINDTYQMALDEMTQLVLPMFANAEDMRFDGHNEVSHDFTVACNSDRLLSIVQQRSQTQGEGRVNLSLEAQTFDTAGVYAGDPLTLRGVTLVLAGVDPATLDDVTAEDAPDYPRIVDGSSVEMGEALLDALYPRFQALQQSGVIRPELTQSDYELEFSPTRDFYVNAQGQVVFFFPPMLMTEPSFDPPVFAFRPSELEAMLGE